MVPEEGHPAPEVPAPRFPGERQLRRAAQAVGLGYVKRFLLRLLAPLIHRLKVRRSVAVQGLYGAGYYAGAEDRQAGVSGYGNYTRSTSNADVSSYLLWRFLPFTQSLDVGCAKGFLVEGLVELGYDAHGWDVSKWAVADADAAIRDRLSVVDLERRQLTVGRPRYDLVTAFEVLEHVDPSKVPQVLKRLRRVSDGYLVATIPSIGVNANGPDGFPDGKVRAESLERYKALGPTYDGPIPFEDLAVDAAGGPVEGHLTIASYAWWTRQFEAAGFVRQPEVEKAMHPVIGRFGLTVAWNLYVFHVDSRDPAPMVKRREPQLAELEQRWDLVDREPGTDSRNHTFSTVGHEAVAAIEREYEASRRRGIKV